MEGSRGTGRALGGKGFTFSDPRILLMANVDLTFLLSPHSCLESAAEGVLTAFR